MAIIEVKDLVRIYKVSRKEEGLRGSLKGLFLGDKEDKVAVNRVSFEIEEGKMVGLIGPNGAGKTTILKMLSGLLYPSAGSIQIMGLTPWKRTKEFQRNLTFILGQKQQLWWDLPAIESFSLNKEIYGVPDNAYKQILDELIELMDVGDLVNTQVRNLSLGERMKMEIIAGLVHQPKLVFLDEPTIGLDAMSQKRIIRFFKEYNARNNSTIILTSHYMKDIEGLCEDIMIINEGSLVYKGSINDIQKFYSQSKSISVTFSSAVEQNELCKIDGYLKSDEYSAVYNINRKNILNFINKIMRLFPIEDINISDEPLEDIVENIINNNRMQSK